MLRVALIFRCHMKLIDPLTFEDFEGQKFQTFSKVEVAEIPL